jgi:hypothetical protein
MKAPTISLAALNVSSRDSDIDIGTSGLLAAPKVGQKKLIGSISFHFGLTG